MPDGSTLYARLAAATPSDGPLEGSGLAWLYNPVFVVAEDGRRRKAWTDFAGSGMAVVEDRYGANDIFEFWMCERDDMVALLAAIDGARHANDGPLQLDHLPESVQEALALARDMWWWGRQVADRQRALRHWPESFAELRALLKGPAEEDLQSTELRRFADDLTQIARKRFPRPDGPALPALQLVAQGLRKRLARSARRPHHSYGAAAERQPLGGRLKTDCGQPR